MIPFLYSTWSSYSRLAYLQPIEPRQRQSAPSLLISIHREKDPLLHWLFI